MSSASALFLQVVIALIGIAILAFLLWEPHVEGRNATATVFEIYFKDPVLAYIYLGSIPFFMAVYRALRLLGDVRRSGTFSEESVSTLRGIKRCAMVLLGFVAGMVVIVLAFGEGEDRPAGVFMCLLATLGATSIAVIAARSARRVQRALQTASA